MATIPRRALAVLIAALATLTTLGLSASPAQAAGADIPVTVTISTPDGSPFDAPMIVRLHSVLETGGSVYATPQDTAFLTPDGSSSRLVELEAPTSGYYTISVILQGTTTRYLPTWLGGGGTAPASMDDPNIFLIDEQAQPSLGHAITLRKAQRISGVVRGTDGQPLDNVTVSSMKWENGQLVSAGRDSLTGRTGAYSVAVPPGTEASLMVRNRVGYAPWNLGGQGTTQTTANTLVMDQDRTQDITLTPDWSSIGASPAIVRDEACLTSSISGTADLDGLLLDVSSHGYVVPKDTDYAVGANPLDIESDVPALVPYWTDVLRPFTWGVADGRLCAVWRPRVGETTTYQLLLDSDGHATINYGSISPNQYVTTAQAGWTEGSSEDDELVVLPREGNDGYADGQPTALTAGSLGSTMPGRYRFDFVFPPPTSRAAAALTDGLTLLPEQAGAGDTLEVDRGTWTTPAPVRTSGAAADAPAGTTFEYQWLRDYTVVPGATQPTFRTSDDDAGKRITVRVTARRAGFLPVVERTGTTLLGSRPTAPAPRVNGTPIPDQTLTVETATWSDGATTATYQWRRDGEDIDGATDATYVVTDDDLDHALTVLQTSADVPDRAVGRVVSRAVTVQLPDATDPDSPGAPGSGDAPDDDQALPDTGAPVTWLLGLGAAMALLGALVRRRRAHR